MIRTFSPAVLAAALAFLPATGIAVAGEERGVASATAADGPIATIEPDVIYGRADALAMTYDLLKPTA